jgi:hypothetical protein
VCKGKGKQALKASPFPTISPSSELLAPRRVLYFILYSFPHDEENGFVEHVLFILYI